MFPLSLRYRLIILLSLLFILSSFGNAKAEHSLLLPSLDFQTSLSTITPNTASQLKPIKMLGRESMTAFDISPDGTQITLGTTDSTQIIDLHDPKKPDIYHLDDANIQVTDIAYSGDGSLVAVSNFDGETSIYKSKDKTLLERFKSSYSLHIMDAAFSPDGTLLATVDSKVLRIWAVGKGAKEPVKSLTFESHSLAFSPDGKYLALAENASLSFYRNVYRRVKIFDIEKKQIVSTIQNSNSGDTYAVAFSPNGKLIAAVGCATSKGLCEQGEVRLWNFPSRSLRATIRAHSTQIVNVSFSLDSQTLATSAINDTEVIVWDARNLRQLSKVDTRGHSLVTFRQIGLIIANLDAGEIVQANPTDGTNTLLLSDYGSKNSRLYFDKSGSYLYAGGTDVKIWDVQASTLAKRIPAVSKGIQGWATNPEGTLVAVIDNSRKQVLLWNTAELEQFATLRSNATLTSLAISPDSGWLATGLKDGRIQLWNLATQRLMLSINAGANTKLGSGPETYSVAFSADNTSVAVAVSGRDQSTEYGDAGTPVNVWELKNPNKKRSIELLRFTHPLIVKFSQDGNYLATFSMQWAGGSAAYLIASVFDFSSGVKVAELSTYHEGLTDLAISPDNKLLVVGRGGTIIIWDIAANTQVVELASIGKADISGLAFDPSGTLLASADSSDGHITLWGVEN